MDQAPTYDGRTLKTVTGAFQLLELVKQRDGMRIDDVADELDMARSTAYRYLLTLHEAGYLTNEDGTYYVSIRFLDLGDHARKRNEAYTLAREVVDELAEVTGERARFLVEEAGHVYHVYRANVSDTDVEVRDNLGRPVGMHASAAGKAILSEYSRDRIRELVSATGLPQLTEHTITDPETLFDDIQSIKRRGYSFNEQETLVGLNAVGVPVTGVDGEVVGALCVAGPSRRLNGDWFTDELPNLLLGAAEEIEINLRFG